MNLLGFLRQSVSEPPAGSYAARDPVARGVWRQLMERPSTPEGDMVKAVMERSTAQRAGALSLGVPDIGFKGIRQQPFQRHYLIDLYTIGHNNGTLKSAINVIKQEVFRRGLVWRQAFEYKHRETGRRYSLADLEEVKANDEEQAQELQHHLVPPDSEQRKRFQEFVQRVNIYDQSLLHVLQQVEDDLNIADDAFIYLSSDYALGWDLQTGREVVEKKIRQLFRVDPVFMEFDTDDENRPGFAHHVCLLHRDELLDIPKGGGWEHSWQGRCSHDGHTTYPVIFRYSPYKGTFGLASGRQSPNAKTTYLVKGEVIHASKFSPSELYGYSPVLAIYEKVLSLIGMDRYLYDYLYERQMPQGVVTTVTDNPEDLMVRKEQLLAEMLNNPHYIPWLAVSSKSGQGRTEFVRFAFSLDELQFLPVQEHIERQVAALYGVPNLFMGDTQGIGGLNNESQQVTRLSRGARLSQAVYNVDVLPALLHEFGITDWDLELETAEEYSEQFELELKQRRAQWAQTMVGMGFGMQYNQELDQYRVTGEVLDQQAQQEMWNEQQQMAAMQGEQAMQGGEEMPEDGMEPEGAEDPDAVTQEGVNPELTDTSVADFELT